MHNMLARSAFPKLAAVAVLTIGFSSLALAQGAAPNLSGTYGCAARAELMPMVGTDLHGRADRNQIGT